MATPLFSVKKRDCKSNNSELREYFEFLTNLLEEIKSENLGNLENITEKIFAKKSIILGKLTECIIKDKYSKELSKTNNKCSSCGKNLNRSGKGVKRTVETMVGRIEICRPYFYCRQCKRGHYPMDKTLRLAEGSKQYDIQKVETWLSSELPYKTACKAYKMCTGMKNSDNHMHKTTNKVAECISLLDICPTQNEVLEKIEKLQTGKFRKPIMMLAIDGAQAPTRPEPFSRNVKRGKGEWREVKGFRLYLLNSKKIEHLISWHQIGDEKQVEAHLKILKEAHLIPEDKVRLCVIADGAPWIWKRVNNLFPSAKQVLDFYHCAEHVYEVANLHYNDCSQKAKSWAQATLTRLSNKKLDSVLWGLDRMNPSSYITKEKIVSLRKYLLKHEHRITYKSYKLASYHISSGAIESSNKLISHVRLKRSGAWWYPSCANHILKLRCAKINGTFDKVFQIYQRKNCHSIYKNC